MVTQLRIMIAHADRDTVREVRQAVDGTHAVVAEVHTAAEFIAVGRDHTPDVVIIGTSFPDGDGIEAAIALGNVRPIPAVVVTSRQSLELVTRAMADHVMAYLIEPVQRVELLAAIVVAWTRFEQLRDLEEQIGDLREALVQRRVIERAKGIIMASESLTEAEAFQSMRRTAQDRRTRMIDIATEIVAKAERATEDFR